MYELDWAQRDAVAPLGVNPVYGKSRLVPSNIHRMALLRWEEHCLECSVPACYRSCPLYVRRADGGCARFVYGIAPNRDLRGVLGWGADIQFRRWAKLETGVYLFPVSPITHRLFSYMDRVGSIARNGLIALAPKKLAYGLHWRYAAYRNRLLRSMSHWRSGLYDAFVIECFSPNKEAFQLVTEYRDTKVRYRDSFRIVPGMNTHVVSAQDFGFLDGDAKGKLTVYPENNAEIRIVFTCLDLIKWGGVARPQLSCSKQVAPAAKVKCVAWDLDNTLWEGILIEDGPDNLALRQEAVTAIKGLDKRGVIHTIVSKNEHDQAWAVIERMGLADYFIYPAINWADKGSNIRQISQRLNIAVDSIALVDDSPFERAAVQHALPQVRVYSDQDISELLSRAEFESPVTEMSRRRRLSYLAQVQREHAQEGFNGEYHEFLRRCQMKMEIFEPRGEEHVLRCWELIQRTNQLNLSARRYSSEEFDGLLHTRGILCVAFRCSDSFGDYGVVGFASIDERRESAQLMDLVISCRVAQKRIEHAFMKWLSDREIRHDRKAIEAKLIRTERNGPLLRVFDELPFEKVQENRESIVMRMALDASLEDEGIVSVQAHVGEEQSTRNQ